MCQYRSIVISDTDHIGLPMDGPCGPTRITDEWSEG
jgi:hypothetical protein